MIICNKTAGYHRHIFRPHILLKMLFKRMRTFLFKEIVFLHIFFNFSKLKYFQTFLQKNFTIEMEKAFSRNDIIWYAFYSKFVTFNSFSRNSRFFPTKPIFSKKTQVSSVLTNLTFSVAFCDKFAIIWLYKDSHQNRHFRYFCRTRTFGHFQLASRR